MPLRRQSGVDGISEPLALCLEGGQHRELVQVHLSDQELIRVYGLQTKRGKSVLREILQIGGDDAVGMARNGGGKQAN